MAEEKNKAMESFCLKKVVLNIGATEEKLDRGCLLLEKITTKKPVRVKATRRIPTWQVRPGLEVGCKVTLRGSLAEEILNKLLPAVDNTLKKKQIQDNFFSFGINEYIDIPGVEYMRDIGVLGFEVTAVFERPGKHVERKKVKRSKTPQRMKVGKEEICNYLETKYNTEIVGGKK